MAVNIHAVSPESRASCATAKAGEQSAATKKESFEAECELKYRMVIVSPVVILFLTRKG
ncbi:MAG: hypothetical protein WAN46_18110 [Gammaproteobacteria bacterium]